MRSDYKRALLQIIIIWQHRLFCIKWFIIRSSFLHYMTAVRGNTVTVSINFVDLLKNLMSEVLVNIYFKCT